jgi:hypothetical protein
MKKIRGGKPFRVIIHIYMELSQGNSLSTTFFSNRLKFHVFRFIFFFFLLQNQRTGGQNKSCPGDKVGTSGRGEVMGKGSRRMNVLQKKCVHM